MKRRLRLRHLNEIRPIPQTDAPKSATFSTESARPRDTLLRVIIPSARIGLIIGFVFAFILTFGDFVSPFYLGGSNPPTLSILIVDTTKSGQQWPRAAVVAVMMIVTLSLIHI